MLQSHSGVDGLTPAAVGRSPAVWLPCEHEHKHAQRVNADAFFSFSFFFACCVVFAFKTSCNSSPHQCNRRSEHVACENMTNKSTTHPAFHHMASRICAASCHLANSHGSGCRETRRAPCLRGESFQLRHFPSFFF